MNHEQLNETLSAYIDGELSAEETARVERLIAADPKAAKLLVELRQTVELVRTLPRHAAPSSIAAEIQSLVEREALLDDSGTVTPRGHVERVSWVGRLAMAAMVGLVVVSGWWYVNEPRPKGGVSHREQEKLGAKPAESVIDEAMKGVDSSPPTTPTDRLAMADIDRKLAGGATADQLLAHRFDNEAIRVRFSVSDASAREAVVGKVLQRLQEAHSADPRSDQFLRLSKTKASGSTPSFYVLGQAGVNFSAAEDSQILIHGPRSQIDRVLAEAARAVEAPEKNVQLQVGSAVAQGVTRSRRIVQLLGDAETDSGDGEPASIPAAGTSPATESPEAKSAPTVPPGADASGTRAVAELLRSVGVDPDLFIQPKGTTAPVEQDEKKAGAAGHETSKATTLAEAAEPLSGTPIVSEPGKLVERRSEAARSERSAAPVAAMSPSEPAALTNRGIAIDADRKASRAKRTEERKADPPISLVIEIVVSRQSPPGVTKPSPTPPMDPKEKR
ncbi:MAG: zf-HC2 domain-containing protein [Planctomycetota bacterium]